MKECCTRNICTLLLTALLSSCALPVDRPTALGHFVRPPKPLERTTAGAKLSPYLALPPCPSGCLMRAYHWEVLDSVVANRTDWTDYLRLQGCTFPRGGFACYMPSEHVNEPRFLSDEAHITLMRIYDPSTKQVLQNVTLFLTPAEADELGQCALDLAQAPKKNHHHVSDAEFKREITIAVYTAENLLEFDAESRKVIDA